MSRVLVVEDDKDIAELIVHYLQKAGHTVDIAVTGTAGLTRAKDAAPDLILLDLMLPGMDGLMVCQMLRSDPGTAGIPIIMLTARGEEAERIAGLELGADDYVTKPFSPRELTARVAALLRRVQRPAGGRPGAPLGYGPLTIDVERHAVEVNGADVRLTAKEFLLLQYLVEHRGRVLSRDRLLTDVWGYQYTGGTRTVDVHIRRLREKVPFLAGAITTIKQFGYRLEDPVTFRAKIFLTALAAAVFAVVVATALVSWSVRRSLEQRIEHELGLEARMAAEILSHHIAATEPELDVEADALGRILGERVTFIAADGRVVGDSDLNADQLRAVENHAARPEIVEARRLGFGAAQRHSTTVDTDMMYVAIPVNNPGMPLLSFVRLALPLTDVDRQLTSVRSLAALGLAAGLCVAVALTWIFSAPLARRLRAIDERARRYAAGNLSRSTPDYGQDEIGSVARMLDSLTHDLTNRLAGLEADRARLAAILSGMIEGVLVVNAHGRLQLANEAARRMLRIDDAVEGRHYPEIVRQPAVARQIEAALAGLPTESVELTGLRDPEMTLIARTAPVVVSPGHGAVVVLHDITDLRRADRIRRDFVANVSHELRTPLTAIRGYVEALADADPEESRRFLEIVARHTMRMERLVRDLLRLARLDAGQEAVERVPCSIEGLFSAVEGDLSGLLAARRQTVERTVAPEAATVPGDPAKLQDALRNLLENATNHAPEGGRITMAARRAGDRIVITVADEGPGIPPADLTRVFERFYRVDKSRTREGKDPGGTGLGLSIVRHLVELHGGRVSAANRPEHGAIFTVELPT